MADPAKRYRDQVDPEHGLAMTAIGFARSVLEGQRQQLEKFLAAEQDMHNFGGLLEPTLYRDILHSKSFAHQVRLARAALAFLKEADAVMAEMLAEAGPEAKADA